MKMGRKGERSSLCWAQILMLSSNSTSQYLLLGGPCSALWGQKGSGLITCQWSSENRHPSPANSFFKITHPRSFWSWSHQSSWQCPPPLWATGPEHCERNVGFLIHAHSRLPPGHLSNFKYGLCPVDTSWFQGQEEDWVFTQGQATPNSRESSSNLPSPHINHLSPRRRTPLAPFQVRKKNPERLSDVLKSHSLRGKNQALNL